MQKDIISKALLKNIAKDISRHILHINVKEDMELIDKEFTRIEKRDADLLYKSGNEIVHIEIQNNNHPKMHLRMLRYYSDILFEYEGYKVRQYMLYVGKNPCSMKSILKRDQIDFSYAIIDTKEIPCERLLESEDPSAVALAILCDFDKRDKQEVINTILGKLLKLSTDEIEFRSHLKMVETLSSNRALEKFVKQGEEMLNVNVEKMPSFAIGLERGLEKGLAKGLEKGLERGLEKGLARGKIEERLRNALIMIQEFNLPMEIVIEKLKLTQEELLEYIRQTKEN